MSAKVPAPDGVRHTGAVPRSPVQLARRVAITVAGALILAVGVVLLVAPGPGVLVIALGFFVLGLEYEWAQRRFIRARRAAGEVADKAVSSPGRTALSIAGCLAIVAAGIVYGVVDTLPGSSWWVAGTVMAGGIIALATVAVSLVQARGQRRERGQPFGSFTQR